MLLTYGSSACDDSSLAELRPCRRDTHNRSDSDIGVIGFIFPLFLGENKTAQLNHRAFTDLVLALCQDGTLNTARTFSSAERGKEGLSLEEGEVFRKYYSLKLKWQYHSGPIIS